MFVGKAGRAMFSTPLYCAACECWTALDECWVCGGPVVADHEPEWRKTHTFSPGREYAMWRDGVTVACGPLIDNLI